MEQPQIEWRLPTRLVRGGLTRSPHSETSEALYLTSGYVYDTAEEAAAVFAALASILKAGDRLVASRALFGSCLHVVAKILPPFGIETRLVDGTDIGQWRDALKGGARAVFPETPSNPTLEIIDLPEVCSLAHEAVATVVVDNVFASPLLQKPLEVGADIVVYSATKHIDGQGRCLGCAVLGPSKFVDGPLFTFLRHTGPALSPFNAWVLLKGLETLDLTIARHSASAEAIAGWLESRQGIRRMLYPRHPAHSQAELARRLMRGGGSIIAFDLEGGRQRAFRFLNVLKLIDISNNLGDSKSLVTHPATTTHSRLSPEEREHLGITEGPVRLHVGLEDTADIEDDLAQALTN